MPRVTVLMPVYNVASYVEEAIRSVLDQSYKDFTLLVLDDHSDDSTPQVVASIPDARIQLVRNDKNLGLADNLNKGLSLVQTELMARMDGDDIALPTWLESEVAYLDAHPEVGVCGAGAQRFGTSQSLVVLPEQDADIRVALLFNCPVLVPTVRMEVIRRHQLRYRADSFPAEDYRFWADCADCTQLHNLSLPLFRYRMHPSQICTSKVVTQKQKANEVRAMMLQRMSAEITQADIEWFTTHCLQAVDTPSQYKEMRQFAQRLLSLNAAGGYFSQIALSRTLDEWLHNACYDGVLNRFFAQGYSVPAYWRYATSGMAWRCRPRHEVRFFAKSVLRRKK